jgi:hypothetical protein
MPNQNNKRYYVHGDRSEENPEQYYCKACDVFFEESHFHNQCHCKDHFDRYKISLKAFNALIKNGSAFKRPSRPDNLFA